MDDNYKALWTAVLEQAIKDALSSNIFLRKSAWAWINSKNQNLGSFLWVTDTLGIESTSFQTLIADKDESSNIASSSR